MARGRRQLKPLPTIGRVPDEVWAAIKPILDQYAPPKQTGRKRLDPRAALDASLSRLRSGCPWNQLPREFPDDRAVPRTCQRGGRLGVFERLGARLVEACEELGGVDGAWQAADGLLGKARLGGPDRPHPDRPWPERHPEASAGRAPGRAAGGSRRRGERARGAAPGGDQRGPRGRTAGADRRAAPAAVPGQGRRQPPRAAGGGRARRHAS